MIEDVVVAIAAVDRVLEGASVQVVATPVSLDEVAPVGTVYLVIVILTVEQIVRAPIGVERVLPTACFPVIIRPVLSFTTSTPGPPT